ncbi:hypothetical protein IFR04_002082 [Cadophora malorum]|uniref:BTB domain-containing protein n=1 Tax=Cadophora malorum TaxID=108018 RepID=A0A8H8BV19_9HELO|nr:hypothetical protein IFR04_002082 [Cadophora malorum]
MASSKVVDLNLETLGTEIVTIHVGPKRKAFSLHKKLLCSRSAYFNKAFNGGFKETEGTIYLPEDDPTAFDALVVFIYQNSLPLFPSKQFPANIEGCDCYADVLERIIFFADKLCINELANKSMDLMQDLEMEYSRLVNPERIANVYKRTGPKSKFRLYCTATRCYDLRIYESERMERVKKLAIEVPEFGADMLEFNSQYGPRIFGKTKFDPGIRDGEAGLGRCFFHTHYPGEICHLTAELSET